MIQTNDGIVGSIFGLKDPEKDQGKVLTPEIDRQKDRGKVLTPKIDRKIDQDTVLGTEVSFLKKSRKMDYTLCQKFRRHKNRPI